MTRFELYYFQVRTSQKLARLLLCITQVFAAFGSFIVYFLYISAVQHIK